MTATDYPAVRQIFAEGASSGNASYKSQLPEEFGVYMDSRAHNLAFVAVAGEEVCGFVSAGFSMWPWTLEDSIYVARRGAGVGSALLQHLIAQAKQLELGAIHSLIFPENEGSRRLHAKAGFQLQGTLHRVIHMQGVWRDAEVWEYLL